LDDRYLKMKKVAEILDSPERNVLDLITAGELNGIRISARAIRISEKSLSEFIERRKINPEDILVR